MPYYTSNDGCRIFYEDTGSGAPLVMIHGWSQSHRSFKKNIQPLSEKFRVIAVDLRGHGASDNVEHGYRIPRLAKDVHDLIESLNLSDVNILGWSMGCSVIWAYWDLFVSEHLSKIILVDEPGLLLKNEENELGMSTYEEVLAMNAAIKEDQLQFSSDLINNFTFGLTSEEKEFMIQDNLKFPAEYAARLEFHHWLTDWRDIVPRINIPTLVISGRKSFINWRSQEWNHKSIDGSKIEYFEESGHFMFFECPDQFNKIVSDFVSE